MKKDRALLNWIKKQCPDLPAAKAFIRKWKHEWDQNFPEPFTVGKEDIFSQRCMAAHLSLLLEGKDPLKVYKNKILTDYLSTEYGIELYCAIFDNDTEEPT